jgi:inner membrane protein
MDPFTHAIVPYLASRGARARKSDRFAALIGGIAPDLDIIFSYIPILAPQLYLLSHRGLFHSFAAMWLMVLLAFYLVTRDPMKRAIKRFMKYDVELEISMRTVAIGYLGAVTHMFVDYLTENGPTLFFPFTEARYSLNLFSYNSDMILVPFGFLILFFSTRRAWPKMRPAFAAFAVLLLALSCTRVALRANVHMDGEIYPTYAMNEWVVVERGNGSIHAVVYDSLSGKVVLEKTYIDARLNASLAQVLARSDAMPEIRWWLWGNSVVSVNAERDEPNRTWLVHYTSVTEDMDYARSSWLYFWYKNDFTTTVKVKDI